MNTLEKYKNFTNSEKENITEYFIYKSIYDIANNYNHNLSDDEVVRIMELSKSVYLKDDEYNLSLATISDYVVKCLVIYDIPLNKLEKTDSTDLLDAIYHNDNNRFVERYTADELAYKGVVSTELKKVIKQVESRLKKEEKDELEDNSFYESKVIDLILYNNDKDCYRIYVSNDEDIGVMDYKNNKITNYQICVDWAYSVDDYIFDDLESGYEISYIANKMHKGMWFEIDTYCLDDIQNKDGFEKYINYCKENDITNEYIDKKVRVRENPTPNIFDNEYLFPQEKENEEEMER